MMTEHRDTPATGRRGSDDGTYEPADTSPASDNADLGRELRELRKARGHTLATLAELSGKSIGYLSQIERGKAKPSLKTLQIIGRILGVRYFRTNKNAELHLRFINLKPHILKKCGTSLQKICFFVRIESSGL